MDWLEKIKALGPCYEAVEWLETQPDAQTAWDTCERSDWMLWLLGNRAGGPRSKSRKRLVLITCECARTALRHVPDGEDRPRRAIETTEAWARGEDGVTLEHVEVAADDAAAYADATTAYAATANADAYAYAYAATAAAYAAYAADADADDSAYAASNAAASDGDAVVAQRALADIIRKHVPVWRGCSVGAWARKDGE